MIYRRMFDVPSWRLAGPFQELENVRQRMENLYSRMLDGTSSKFHAGVFPMVNLTEDKENYYIRAELPGIAAEYLNIQATGRSLSISGERKIPLEGENVKYHRREREAGRFNRGISLPGDIDSEKIVASLVNGVLKIRVPKADAVKPRQISIR